MYYRNKHKHQKDLTTAMEKLKSKDNQLIEGFLTDYT